MALVLQLLGGFHLASDEAGSITLADRRARALLAYLALASSPTSRQALAGLLCAEGDEQDQLATLRQTIYVARKAAGPAIVQAQGSSLSLSEGLVSVDARRFAGAIARGDHDSLVEAVALYRGPFLAGERSPSPAFEDWLMARRSDLLEQATDALLQLARSDAAAGRHGDALAHARLILTLDPLREEAHRQVMRSLAATGQRSAALRHYENARQALAEELGVAPDGETVSLRDVIARGADRPADGSGHVALPARHEAAQARVSPSRASGARRDPSSVRAGPGMNGLVHAMRARHALPLAALLLLLAGGLWWLGRAEPLPSLPVAPPGASAEADGTDIPRTVPAPRLSIVVLPFANLTGDPEQAYFADGITEGLTTDLSRIDGSFVIARHTAFTYQGRNGVDVRAVGRELGVRYVLEGSVRRVGAWVGINAQLVDTATGAHLWAEQIEGSRDDLLALYSEVTGRIAATLRLELIEAEGRRVEREQQPDPQALDDAMRGWALMHRPNSREARAEARRLFERALASDPNTVSALVGLAHVLEGRTDSPVEDRQRAQGLLRRALDLEPNRADTYLVLGLVRRSQGRLEEAAEALETAIALDRNYARAHLQLGWTANFLGRPEEAIAHAQRAIRLNPRDPNLADAFFAIGVAHQLLGQVDEAIRGLERARAGNPRLWYFHLHLAAAYASAERLDDARQALAAHRRLRPEFHSIAAIKAALPTVRHPAFQALCERTVYVGLRRAGFPDS